VGEFGEEMLGRVFRRERKLCRKNEGRSKNSFCRRKVGFVMRCGTEGKEEPRKMCYPVWGSTTSSEGSFENSVCSFNKAIGLRVKSCCVDVGYVEEGGKRMPDGGCELGTSV
jgi:hypothetical protein